MIQANQVTCSGNGFNTNRIVDVLGRIHIKCILNGPVYLGPEGVKGDTEQDGLGYKLELGESVTLDFADATSVYFQSEANSPASVLTWMITR